MFSLTNNDLNLTPGEYVVMIDPIWNQTASNDRRYKEILIDIYSSVEIEITPIDDKSGLQYLEQMLKFIAKNVCPPSAKEYYLSENPDYSQVYRITDIETSGCAYGFFYTKNESAYDFSEKFTPVLKGFEIVWP